MSLGQVMNNVFSRQRARYESERIVEDEDAGTEDVMVNQPRATSTTQSHDAIVVEPDIESGSPPPAAEPVRESSEDTTMSTSRRRGSRTEVNDEEDALAGDVAEGDEDGASPADAAAERLFVTATPFGRNTMTLAELEEQRELSRRRSSACVMLAVFVLFRLWIECLQKQDPILLLLCLLGTSWTARWVRYNQEREEELDRRIEAYLQNNNNRNGGDSNEEVMDRNDYARLSFQAQLALAIMESQRHMMEGGYGRPDDENRSPGVSDEAKGRWKQFKWGGGKGSTSKKGDYGAVPNKGDVGDMDPHCSICLCEYEDAETLTELPCHHLYHTECIESWTNNHQKCPLCNLDLESVSGSTAASGETDTIV